jgi:hypothetical protein
LSLFSPYIYVAIPGKSPLIPQLLSSASGQIEPLSRISSHQSLLLSFVLPEHPDSAKIVMPFPSVSKIKERIKAKIEPQLHLRVPFEAGIYENSPRWSNKGNSLLLASSALRT